MNLIMSKEYVFVIFTNYLCQEVIEPFAKLQVYSRQNLLEQKFDTFYNDFDDFN